MLTFVFAGAATAQVPCAGCTAFDGAIALGVVPFSGLSEASGLAASRRNYNVFWTHNDGSQGHVFAISTNGTRLATFDLTRNVDDVEDVAVGPGPEAGVNYLYAGDIGAAGISNNVRASITVLRIPEPFVDLAWATNARTFDFAGVQSFKLTYPDGSYDAETLMVDPFTADVWIATKQDGSTRLYTANLNTATNRQTLSLTFVQTVPFSLPSAGDISPDGSQVVLRREDAAELWIRCPGESMSAALGRPSVAVPVVGPPLEPNGEAIAFLADGTGYATLSEGSNPTLYVFRAQCPRAPQLMVVPTNQTVFAGASVVLQAAAGGNPTPQYVWRFEGSSLPGQTNASLVLTNVAGAQAGIYEVIASNSVGVTSAVASVTVRTMPQLRITEVMPSPTSVAGVDTADWWELTSYEQQPVSLNGWRFNDNSGGLTDPYRITNAIMIHPGESIIFVEGLTAQEFRVWWGETNLSPSLQIVSYGGNGLGLGAGGDAVRLWDSMTADPAATIANVTFGVATTGFSFGLYPSGEFGAISQEGVNGGFRSDATGDVGSPGRIAAPAAPPALSIAVSGENVVITFSAEAGRLYSLESRSDLAEAEWSATGDVWMTSNPGAATFVVPISSNLRFFRVAAN